MYVLLFEIPGVSNAKAVRFWFVFTCKFEQPGTYVQFLNTQIGVCDWPAQWKQCPVPSQSSHFLELNVQCSISCQTNRVGRGSRHQRKPERASRLSSNRRRAELLLVLDLGKEPKADGVAFGEVLVRTSLEKRLAAEFVATQSSKFLRNSYLTYRYSILGRSFA